MFLYIHNGSESVRKCHSGERLKTRGHGDTGTRGQIGWGFDPNQFYAPQVTVGYLTQINFDKN
ncbi:MAG: hypothetical protein F6K58_06105 [Symploca sp. SIO2E9]|nr:hypothetical protein [Symploca sp. SIO2E9]